MLKAPGDGRLAAPDAGAGAVTQAALAPAYRHAAGLVAADAFGTFLVAFDVGQGLATEDGELVEGVGEGVGVGHLEIPVVADDGVSGRVIALGGDLVQQPGAALWQEDLCDLGVPLERHLAGAVKRAVAVEGEAVVDGAVAADTERVGDVDGATRRTAAGQCLGGSRRRHGS